jgi:hypothetical protein
MATEVESLALEILRKHGPMRASDLGWQLWGDNDSGAGQGSHGHNKYCRSAGKLLRRLDAAGKVVSRTQGTYTLWTALG